MRSKGLKEWKKDSHNFKTSNQSYNRKSALKENGNLVVIKIKQEQNINIPDLCHLMKKPKSTFC